MPSADVELILLVLALLLFTPDRFTVASAVRGGGETGRAVSRTSQQTLAMANPKVRLSGPRAPSPPLKYVKYITLNNMGSRRMYAVTQSINALAV